MEEKEINNWNDDSTGALFGGEPLFFLTMLIIVVGLSFLIYWFTTPSQQRISSLPSKRVLRVTAVMIVLGIIIGWFTMPFFACFLIPIWRLAIGFNKSDIYYQKWNSETNEWEDEYYRHPTPCKNILYYNGKNFNFSESEIVTVLNKRFPFYNSLAASEKSKFLSRIVEFIGAKQFVIHDTSGFKEMPILISATAIQLSFGWEKYLLPSITEIHVYPDAFISYQPFLRALEGNVCGNQLNISWKHFVDGFTIPDNGENVGLHELAHAYQNEMCNDALYTDFQFKQGFQDFSMQSTQLIFDEKLKPSGLYTEYALQSIDEIWASSIELFFEKPFALKSSYPAIYNDIARLLNHYPLSIKSLN